MENEKSKIKEVIYQIKLIFKSIYFRSFYISIFVDYIFKNAINYKMLIDGKFVSAIWGYLVLYVSTLIVLMLLSKILSNVNAIFNSGIPTSLLELISNSKEYIYIVSPFLNPGNLIIEELIKKRSQGVEITVIHNTNELNKNEFIAFYNRTYEHGIKFVNNPNLHAKVYCSEQDVIITSMNLTSSSMDNSLEAAIFTSYRVLRKEYLSFINDILSSDLSKETKMKNAKINMGFCIKSRQSIAFNTQKPIAYHIYRSDRSPIGKYCHYCGCEYETSIENPFCIKHESMNM